jgi:hypothetical protein
MQTCYPTTTPANDLKLWIFAINGTPDGRCLLNVVDCYDPRANEWISPNNTPTARWFLAAAVLENRLYAIGGWSARSRCLHIAECCDLGANKWMPVATTTPSAPSDLAAVAIP